jgi:UDPglucose 6-dehydrogenase
MITVGIAGLTHLGIITAAGLASKGFNVVAWDPDPALSHRLATGDPIVSEPGLEELLLDHRSRLVFSRDLRDLADADLVYIATDVPTDDQGESDLDGIQSLIDDVAGVLDRKAVLTILCQVPPGFTRRQNNQPHDRLYYQVETLIFGRAVERTVAPERYIIGCADPGRPIPSALQSVLAAYECPILPMRYESAELAKISINCFLVAQVSTTNTLAEICESTGADWSEIAPALRLDRRIGPHAYLVPGLGIAGGNLERDLATVSRLSQANNTESSTVDAWRTNSRWRANWLLRCLRESLLDHNADPLITVLGLAYKENTDSIKNSPSIALLEQLKGRRVRVHDPVVPRTLTPNWVEFADTAMKACENADVIVIATPWPEYRDLDLARVRAVMNGRLLIDPHGMLATKAPEGLGFSWFRLGAKTV